MNAFDSMRMRRIRLPAFPMMAPAKSFGIVTCVVSLPSSFGPLLPPLPPPPLLPKLLLLPKPPLPKLLPPPLLPNRTNKHYSSVNPSFGNKIVYNRWFNSPKLLPKLLFPPPKLLLPRPELKPPPKLLLEFPPPRLPRFPPKLLRLANCGLFPPKPKPKLFPKFPFRL